ncbi:hypothetical protein BaRGS_00011786, partial [Batillaria attramentaria]
LADSTSSPGDSKPHHSAITKDLYTGISQRVWAESISTKASCALQGEDLNSDAIRLITGVSKHVSSEPSGVNLIITTAATASVHHNPIAEPLTMTAATPPPTKTTVSPSETATRINYSPPSTQHKGGDIVLFTGAESGLWRLNFSVCSNLIGPQFKWFQDGDTLETVFELHPDDKRPYQCNLGLSVDPTMHMTVVVEEFEVQGGGGRSPCIPDFAWLTYDDHNQQVGATYPCEESTVIATEPGRDHWHPDLYVDMKMGVNDGVRHAKTNKIPSTLKIFWKFRFYLTYRPGYILVDHVQATSQHAGYVRNFLFNGRRHYSTFTDAFFILRIRASEVLVISFLHFEIDCSEDKLQYYQGELSKTELDRYFGFLPLDISQHFRSRFVWKDTRCGTEPLPPTLYNVTIGIRFYSGTGKTASGFKLHYSIHNATEAPQALGANLFNCSVPYYPSFQQHLQCNLVVQCQGGEDEIDCPYTTADCGLGLIDAGDKCYKYIEERREITWYDAFDKCMEQNARLVTPRTLTEWKGFQEVLQFGMNSSALYVGLQTSESSLGLMYREVWQWADRTMAYFNRALIQSQLPKPACAFLPPVYREIFRTTICGLPMRIGFVLCEFDKHVVANPQYKSLEMNAFTEWEGKFVKCPKGHVVHDFLSCDVASDCSAESYLASCWTPAAGNIHMFVCDASLQTLPYTLVCDHREDCPGGSDEGFCVYHACAQRQCRNGQCVTFDQWCDNMAHCVDGSDEECTLYLQMKGPSTPPPAIVTLDGRGGYVEIVLKP